MTKTMFTSIYMTIESVFIMIHESWSMVSYNQLDCTMDWFIDIWNLGYLIDFHLLKTPHYYCFESKICITPKRIVEKESSELFTMVNCHQNQLNFEEYAAIKESTFVTMFTFQSLSAKFIQANATIFPSLFIECFAFKFVFIFFL